MEYVDASEGRFDRFDEPAPLGAWEEVRDGALSEPTLVAQEQDGLDPRRRAGESWEQRPDVAGDPTRPVARRARHIETDAERIWGMGHYEWAVGLAFTISRTLLSCKPGLSCIICTTAMGLLTFTVIICTKDRREDLTRCLRSLALRLREATPEGWDVLVVDNASSDGTSDMARALESDFPVALRVIYEERKGVAFARNTGLREARGDVVVFADDDVTFYEGWVDAWEEAFSDLSVVAGGGPILPVFPPSSPAWLREALIAERGGPTGRYCCGDEKKVLGLSARFDYPQTGNAAVQRSAALAVGGFRIMRAKPVERRGSFFGWRIF